METFFMNSENSKTSEPHRLKYNLIDKLDFKNPNKNMELAFITLEKILNRFIIIISLKFPHLHGMIHLIYVMDHIIYQLYKIATPILIYTNKISNRIVFKIKTGYKLELLSKETMEVPLGSTKDTTDADKNNENVPRLENVEVVLVHCNLVNNSYQQASRVLFTFAPNKQYGQLISISPNSLIFFKNDEYRIFRNRNMVY